MRKALAYSSNTIAVKVAETLGDSQSEAIDVMIDYLKNFGLSDLKDGPGGSDRNFPALTLGGMTTGASPLDMAAAYGTLANGGVYIEPITFTTVTTAFIISVSVIPGATALTRIPLGPSSLAKETVKPFTANLDAG